MNGPPQILTFQLADYAGRNRLVLIFAPSMRSPTFQSQMELFATAEDGFKARDVELVQLLYEGESHLNEHRLDRDSARRLRDQFGIGDDAFVIVLVGKDGQEKRRFTAPVKPEALFDAIDAMAQPHP